jgi:arylsulfatase
MQWKGTIPAGSVCNKLAVNIDLLPTFAHISGAAMPSHKTDGVNLFSLLKGDTKSTPRTSFLYYYRRNSLEAVSDGEFKLIFPHPTRTYEGFAPGNDGMPGRVDENKMLEEKILIDLRRDPGERYNVLSQYPEAAGRLEQMANEAREDLGDDLQKKEGKNRRAIGTL